MSTLYNISLVAEHRALLISVGIIPKLVEMLSSGYTITDQVPGFNLLTRPTRFSLGGTSNAFCSSLCWSRTTIARYYVASMQWELCASSDAKSLLVQAGAISALVTLLQTEAAEAVMGTAHGVVADEGANRKVEEANDGATANTGPRVLEPVTATLSELARSQSANRMAIMRTGGLPLIVEQMCSSPFAAVVQHATRVLWGLAQESTAIRVKITTSSGAIERLFELLSGGAAESQKLAAATLILLGRDEPCRVQLLRVDAVGQLKLLKMKPDSWCVCAWRYMGDQ